MRKKNYKIGKIISLINKALDELEVQEEKAQLQELTQDEQVLKSDLLSALDILGSHEFD